MDGIIPLLKPPGITSHDAVGIVRRILREKRVGHSGTLDPLAGGVLPIYIGKATRLVEYGDSFSKVYVAEARFGYSTDTEDISGEVIARAEHCDGPSKREVEMALRCFEGKIQQSPSIYSAIKINGRRAYELAREGVKFTLPTREIEIFSIELLRYDYPFMVLRVTCSGGTYIRALLRDIGKELKEEITMSHLVRTSVGPYTIDRAITIEELTEYKEKLLKPMETAVVHLPRLELTKEEAKALGQGKLLRKALVVQGLMAAFEKDRLIGTVFSENGFVKAQKILIVQEN